MGARTQRHNVGLEQTYRQSLYRLPTVERVAIVSGKKAQIVGLDRHCQLDWRGKAPVERWDRPPFHIGEDEGLTRLRQFDHAPRQRRAIEQQRQILAIGGKDIEGI